MHIIDIDRKCLSSREKISIGDGSEAAPKLFNPDLAIN